MNKKQNEFLNLGEQIKDIVTDAAKSMDYGQLNKDIKSTVNIALDEVKKGIEKGTKEAVTSFQQATANPIHEEQFQGGLGQKKGIKKWFSNKESLFPVDKTALKSALGITFVAVGATFTSISLLVTGILAMVIRLPSFYLPPLVIAGGFAAMFLIGRRIQKRKKRFTNYLKFMESRKYIEIDVLAQRSHQSLRYTRNDLQKLIKLGVFPDAHIDSQKRYFMGDYETYSLYMNMKNQQQVTKNTTKEIKTKDANSREKEIPREVLEAARKGQEFVEEIRRANDLIPGEEVSRKLETLELVTKKIFQRVEENPKLLPDIRRFMEYYLPTTKRLVNAYKEFDMQPIQGDSIKKSKTDIEETLDTINDAFTNLYHGLFEEEVMEVHSDISVIQAMLAKEGLTKKDFIVKENE